MGSAERRLRDVGLLLDQHRSAEPVEAAFVELLRKWPEALIRPAGWDHPAIMRPARRCDAATVKRVRAECRDLWRWLKREPRTSLDVVLDRLPRECLDGVLWGERILELQTGTVTIVGFPGAGLVDVVTAGERLRVRLPATCQAGGGDGSEAALSRYRGCTGTLRLPIVDGEPEMVWEYDPDNGESLLADVLVDGRSLVDVLVTAGVALRDGS